MELTEQTLSLPALEQEWSQQAKADPTLLADIAHAIGGPFHLLHPQTFAQNLRGFQQTLAASGVPGQVYYGKKANKAECWLRVVAEAGAGVDVASAHELAQTLRGGVPGADIVVTGPTKNDELLWLSAQHNCLVAIDSLDELDRVLAQSNRRAALRVLLRALPETDPTSRFGLNPGELDEAVARCAQAGSRLSMEGFSFHLNGYEVEPRAKLLAQLADRLLLARAQGLPATSISIGGGFAVSYLEEESWSRFLSQASPEDFHRGKAFELFYPYHQSTVGADMLAAILAAPEPGSSGTVGEKLVREGVDLLLEPGRSLLDGAGFTVFPVQGYKQRDGYGITTVHGVSMSLAEQWRASEFLPDPVLWSPDGEVRPDPDGPVRSSVGGSSCLENDMLTWRKVPFPRAPRRGDLLLYPNTAGYQMDKSESEFHQQPLPPKVVVSSDGSRTRWRLDAKGGSR